MFVNKRLTLLLKHSTWKLLFKKKNIPNNRLDSNFGFCAVSDLFGSSFLITIFVVVILTLHIIIVVN